MIKKIVICVVLLALTACSTTRIILPNDVEYVVKAKYNGKVSFENADIKINVDNTGPTSVFDKILGTIAISRPQIGVD
jgi:hypothetical protein